MGGELREAPNPRLVATVSVQWGIILGSKNFCESRCIVIYIVVRYKGKEKTNMKVYVLTRGCLNVDGGDCGHGKGCCMSHCCDIKITEIEI